MTRSVLDDLGEEITGIIAPVSICMALVVLLVKTLNPDGNADSSSVAIATIAYHEQVGGGRVLKAAARAAGRGRGSRQRRRQRHTQTEAKAAGSRRR
jgi:hypothetical protein